ncbi:MAG: hypothetical protein Q7T79_01545 [bacterium]|nr:hypothetical protein [bacterium]
MFILVWPFIFFFFCYLLINFFSYGFFRSFYLAFWYTYLAFALLSGNLSQILIAIIAIIISYISCAIFYHAKSNKVKFGLLFAIISFIFPLLGVPLYFFLWKKFSTKIGETIKSEEGAITFINR